MDAIAAFLSRLPDEIRHAGGSVPLRLLVLGVALVLNLGFYLPHVSGVPGAGVPGADKIAHVVVFALTVWAAGRVLAPLSRFPMEIGRASCRERGEDAEGGRRRKKKQRQPRQGPIEEV